MLRTVSVSATLLLLATTAAAEDFWLAEDLPFVDIRLGYGLMPIPDKYDVNAESHPPALPFQANQVVEVDTDQSTNLTYSIVGGRMTPIGLLFGGELVYASAEQRVTEMKMSGVPVVLPADTTSLQYRTLGGNFLAGFGWALNRNFHLEALGALGVGSMDLDFSDAGGDGKADGEGWYWNYGARGGAYFTYRKLVIGVVVEYTHLIYTADANFALDDVTVEVDDEHGGIGYRFEIGYHIQ